MTPLILEAEPIVRAEPARRSVRPPHELIDAAVRAANTQNAQPWRFDVGPDAITVFADVSRGVGSFDPFLREMHQSLGCAIENIVQAAAAHGLWAEVEAFPGKLPAAAQGPAARITFASGSSRTSALYDAIPLRRTNRGAYRVNRRVPAPLVREMCGLAEGGAARLTVFDSSQQQRMGQLIIQSTRTIVDDEDMLRDKSAWLRLQTDEAARARDGLTVDTVAATSMDAVTRKLVTPSLKAMHRIWLRDTIEVHVRTAALMGAILVRDPHDRASAIEVGRLWQRVHLWLTARKLAAQPLNQPIERVDRERQLHQPGRTADALSRITCDPTWRPAFIFRAGYPARVVPASLRRSAAAATGPPA